MKQLLIDGFPCLHTLVCCLWVALIPPAHICTASPFKDNDVSEVLNILPSNVLVNSGLQRRSRLSNLQLILALES